jgi:IS5 family transposase
MTGGEAELYADCAYSAQETRDALAARGVADRVQRKGYRNRRCRRPRSRATSRSG